MVPGKYLVLVLLATRSTDTCSTIMGLIFFSCMLFCFCNFGLSTDKTGGAVLLAGGSNKTENSVPRVLFASQTSHLLAVVFL